MLPPKGEMNLCQDQSPATQPSLRSFYINRSFHLVSLEHNYSVEYSAFFLPSMVTINT